MEGSSHRKRSNAGLNIVTLVLQHILDGNLNTNIIFADDTYQQSFQESLQKLKLAVNVRATRNNRKPLIDNEVNVWVYFTLIHQEFNFSSTSRTLNFNVSTHRILKNHKMHPFSEMRQNEEICEFMWIDMTQDPRFLLNIVWTDESKFSIQGIII